MASLHSIEKGTSVGNVRTLLLFVLCSTSLLAQQENVQMTGDTTRVDRPILLDPGFAFGKPIFLLPSSLQPKASLRSILFQELQPGMPPPFLGGGFEQKADLLSPYLLHWKQEQKYKTLYSILGAAQFGGAAYAAYRYIKKHGLR
jgi:hypothetical protein